MSNDTTKEVLREMLTENTGRALCDSGDAYGRHWQRNQGRDFEADPPTDLHFDVYGDREPELSLTHSVYHWLAAKLTFNQDLDDLFNWWIKHAQADKDTPWLATAEEFVGWLGKNECPCQKSELPNGRPCDECQRREEFIGGDVGGIYGDGDPVVINTYNGEDLLSQTIQYVYFEVEGQGGYVLLQIHGGCDARGGYTKPRAFEVNEELGIMDNARAYLSCAGQEVQIHRCAAGHRWQTAACDTIPMCPTCLAPAKTTTADKVYHQFDMDDGYHIRDESYPRPPSYRHDFKYDYEVIGRDEDDDRTPLDAFKPGTIVVDARTKRGYCPHCCSELQAGF